MKLENVGDLHARNVLRRVLGGAVTTSCAKLGLIPKGLSDLLAYGLLYAVVETTSVTTGTAQGRPIPTKKG